LKSWNGLTKDLKNDKIIQILAYAFMFENEMNDIPMEAGIISFKNLKSGFLPFGLKEEKELNTTVTKEILANYVEEIVVLLNEIFNRTISFEENI
jgi:hypothetical protein